jgi:Fe-S cluster biogenesis protein NfuA
MNKIDAIPTPNPEAIKFVLEKIVKAEGKSTYNQVSNYGTNLLAKKLFEIDGVDKLFFRANTITVTKKQTISWTNLNNKILECFEKNLDQHDPGFKDIDLEAIRREKLPKELKQIEEILDRDIRPTLRFDGGDIEVVELISNCLVIKYQGACGSCPSATGGTLRAVQQTLAAEFDPNITVIIDPETRY